MNGNLTFVQAFSDLGRIIARRWWALLLLAVVQAVSTLLFEAAISGGGSRPITSSSIVASTAFGLIWHLAIVGVSQAVLVEIGVSAVGYPTLRGASRLVGLVKGFAWTVVAVLILVAPLLAVLAYRLASIHLPFPMTTGSAVPQISAALLLGGALLPFALTGTAAASLGGSHRAVYRYGWRALRFNGLRLIAMMAALVAAAVGVQTIIAAVSLEGLLGFLPSWLGSTVEGTLINLVSLPALAIPVMAAGHLARAELEASPQGTLPLSTEGVPSA